MDERPHTCLADRAAQGLLTFVLVGCLTIALNGLSDWLSQSAFPKFWIWWRWNNPTAARDLIVTVGGIVTLSVAIWRTWLTGQQAKAQIKTAEAALRQSDIAWRGQLADRFIKTAPLLGGEEINERIGALIALEEISKHSEEHRWSIIELIASFVRESVTIGIKPRLGAGKTLGTAKTDVALALDIIGRSNFLTGQDSREINLSSCDFTNYVFSGNFSQVALEQCVLDAATFKKYEMFETSLSRSVGIVRFHKCKGRLKGGTEEWKSRLDGTSAFDAELNPNLNIIRRARIRKSGGKKTSPSTNKD